MFTYFQLLKITMRYCVQLLNVLITSLLHTTTSTVYYVMPDNDYHPINDNTYTLQHYLNNTNKYFTSNTQLHFLPGQYYLSNDLIIQGVSNFSLIGNRTNEIINTVINCTLPAGIAVVGSNDIVIANIVMNECGNDYKSYIYQYQGEHIKSLFVLHSKSITITYLYSLWHQKLCGFELVNALESTLSNLVSNYLLIWYTGNDNSTTNERDTLFIENFQIYSVIRDIYAIKIAWNNTAFDFQATILNENFTSDLALHITSIQCLGHNTIVISNCSFSDIYTGEDIPTTYDYNYKDDYYSSFNYNYSYEDFINGNSKPICNHEYSCMSKIKIYYHFTNISIDKTANKLLFSDCHFINNFRAAKVLHVKVENNYHWKVNTHVQSVIINNCSFYNNKNIILLSAECYNNDDSRKYCVSVLIKNTTISYNIKKHDHLISVNYVTLTFENSIIINNTIHGVAPHQYNNIIEALNSYIKYSKYNEISNNSANYVIMGALAIHINENSILNISFNFLQFHCIINKYFLPYAKFEICAIQYISERGNLDSEFQSGQTLNYSVIVYMNNMSEISNSNLKHCEWDSTSAFLTSSPLHVNQYFIQQNTSIRKQHKKDICLCNENDRIAIDCYGEEMGPFYPGETVSMEFALISSYTNTVQLEKHHDLYHISCKGTTFSVVIRSHECKNTQFIVTHENGIWCELLLTAVPQYSAFFNIQWTDIYTITFLPCPKGFSLHSEGYCWCDTILSSYIPSITHCNIDNQTIPRPANSWISAHTVNNSHSYHVSLHCPFDYCLPHSSHLNLSTPDSQCQFNRSGLLCGQCQQGLSAVFGSSQCKQCSNVYLLIIIPIGIAGLVLVLLLFVLNLTVTDGNINAFLLYVNIISINSSIFFPVNNTATHIFISLANLDLGITTCFYNGMDNYAKIWLQLMFPAYLILIATSLIIASRYSGRIQRLTARRALPVLATLFLLSYTKVLLIVSGVLFFYSTTVHLPSNKATVLWLVDPNVPLFGAKFIILFTVCLILFLVLISFNMILIFTKTLGRFKIINYFKPLLDAYQGPYKIKFYYWTGLQLLLRAIIFGLSALDKSLNVMSSILLLGALIWSSEKLSPFKRKGNALIKKLFLSNLYVMLVINTSQYDTVNNIVISVLISLAMLQLLCIVIWHFKTLLTETFPKCEIVFDFKKVSLQLSNFFKVFRNLKGREDSTHDLELVNPVPEKTYNYEEFQEPLIAI